VTLQQLFALIQSRRDSAPPGSYTAKLFAAGEDEIVKKVGEEAVEVILAVTLLSASSSGPGDGGRVPIDPPVV
jgi:phosphoribosyl-ATP pyrophosphohydrolase